MSALTDEKMEFPVSVALSGGRRQEMKMGPHTTWKQFRQRVRFIHSRISQHVYSGSMAVNCVCLFKCARYKTEPYYM